MFLAIQSRMKNCLKIWKTRNCSTETEASLETISFLEGKADELGLNSVLNIEGIDNSIAETIIQNTKTKNQSILTFDSMQSITSDGVKNGSILLLCVIT